MALSGLNFADYGIVVNGQPVEQPTSGIWEYHWAVIRFKGELRNAQEAAARILAINAKPAPLGLVLAFYASLERGFWSPNFDLVCLDTRATKTQLGITGALTPYWRVPKVRGYDQPYTPHDEFLVYTVRKRKPTS